MTLQPIAKDLWTTEHSLRIAGLPIGTRTSVVRLGDGSLLLHSPGPLDPAAKSALEALGPVRALVAPNALHHFYVEENARAFPEARIYGAPGVAAKQPGVHFHEELGDTPPEAWSADLDQLLVRGAPGVGEVVFLHRPSRTLLLTDLAFNVCHSDSAFMRFFMRLNGGYGRFGPTRMLKSRFRDRAAVRASVERILAWDFDRVSVTHGEILGTGGREALRDAFAGI